MANEMNYNALKDALKDLPVKVYAGMDSIVQMVQMKTIDVVLTAMVGYAGLLPTIKAIEAGKDIALANKETLVTAGDIVMAEVKKYNAQLIPVDSEHSAIFQCSPTGEYVKNLLITASGGPFLNKSVEYMKNATKNETLKHPKWDMGNKITIDSATMFNKAFEVIEAYHLFNVKKEQIQVIIHPQSIVHSMVEFSDNAVIAQMGVPDMKLPIQYALTYPKRLSMSDNALDLTKKALSFEIVDRDTFRCLDLAYRAGNEGGTMPTVLNGANEVAVALFLDGKIGFLDIAELVETAMESHKNIKNPSVSDILSTDSWAREYVFSNLHKIK